MVLKKSKLENSTLFIDASRECIKVTNNNKLTQANIEKIIAAYAERLDAKHFAKLVPNGDIAAQAYNLTVGTYIEREDKREAVDITALNAEIAAIVERENKLREEIAKIIEEIEHDK